MKNIFGIIFLCFFCMVVAILGGGCAPYYGSAKGYDNGDWFLFSSQDKAAEYKLQKMAFDGKAPQEEPGKVKRYAGIVANESWQKISWQIRGPEKVDLFMDPNKSRQEVIELFPGTYTASVFIGGNFQGSHTFHVRPNEKSLYNGEQVNWFVYYKP